jgi:hypothetical protein
MQFKDEMLKNIRELERKIMTKVNKNQEDLSSDLNNITASLNSLKTNNNAIIDSITETKLNFDKISHIESDLIKFHTALNGQEKKINETMLDISFMKEQYEKSFSDALIVPGIIGKNCKYKNFNDYIVNINQEISRLKTEKEYSRKESRELKQKLEQGIKSMSNLVDSFVGRAKIYTDGTKKGIIELMDTRISEFDSKNMELFSKFYKMDSDFNQKFEKFDENLNNLNLNTTEEIKRVEERLTKLNNNLEEIYKYINETKEELKYFKNNEEKYMNELEQIKNNFNNIIKIENNNNNENCNTITSDINYSKEITSVINQAKNMKEINNIIIKPKPNFNEILLNNNNINNNKSCQTNNNESKLNQKDPNLVSKRSRNITNNPYNDKQIIEFSNNNINNAISSFNNNFQKNLKVANSELANTFLLNNKKISLDDLKEEEEINNLNTDKNSDFANKTIKSIKSSKKLSENKEKNSYIKNDEIAFFLNKKIKKDNLINSKIKLKKEKFPLIKEKIFNNIIFSNEGFFNAKNYIKNNNLNLLQKSKKKISPNKNKSMNDKSKNKNKNGMIISIDKETGVGCNIVKLSIDDDNITPYNTNGLITMASNKFFKKKFIKSEESTSFSFDNIFSNICNYTKNIDMNNNLQNIICNKTLQALLGDDKNNLNINSVDNNLIKEINKVIKKNETFDDGKIMLNKNKK